MYKRNTFGHWEADTVVSGKINNYTLKSKYCFVSLAKRKTRLYLVKLIPDWKEETVTNAIIELLKDLPEGAVKTITCDRGKEFAGWKRIEEELNTKMYFADPYCTWQKGTNENSNGLLREFILNIWIYPRQTKEKFKMFLNFSITDQENALTIKHLKSYLMSIYVNVALDLTNYLTKKSCWQKFHLLLPTRFIIEPFYQD